MRIGKRVWAVTILAAFVAIALNVFDAAAVNIEPPSIPSFYWDTEYLAGDSAYIYLGPFVRVPNETYWTANGRGGSGRLGCLQVFATEAVRTAGSIYGIHIYADTTLANYPARLLNMVANAPTGGTVPAFIAQRVKVNVETSVSDPAIGIHILNNATQNMWGLYVKQPQPDSAIATNIYSEMTNLEADKDGKTASNIYTDGGHVKFLDGDTETESLYVDLDHTVIASDTVELGGMIYVPTKAAWPGPLVTTASGARLNMLHTLTGLPSGPSGIIVVGDTTLAGANQSYMLSLLQPAVDSKQMASSKFISIQGSETTASGAARGLNIDWASGVSGYPINIECDNTDYVGHVNIYSTIVNDNGASWNIYASGGRNYFGGGATTIADTLILSSAQTAGWGTLGAEGLLVVNSTTVGDSSNTAFVLTYIGASDGTVTPVGFLFADSLQTGSKFVVKSTNAAGDVGRHFSWVIIRH